MAISPASVVLGASPGGASTPVVSTPATITADQNNYDLGAVDTARISSDARRRITGIAGTLTPGRKLRLVNVGANPIEIGDQDTASTAAHRIITGADSTGLTGATSELVLGPNMEVDLEYDGPTARWRVTAIYGGNETDFVFSFSGVLTTAQNNLIPRLSKLFAVEVYGFRMWVQEMPVGSSILVSIRRNGGALETMTISASSLTSGEVAVVTPHLYAAGQYADITIDQVGSTTPGTTLTAILRARRR